MSVELNLPGVREEIEAMVDAYDRALQANDVPAVMSFFWNHAETVRFGPPGNAYGWEAINAFRAARPNVPRPRTILRTHVAAFGPDHGVAHVETLAENATTPGRQTQTWVRMPEGWKIVSAHVSVALTG